MFKSTKLHGAGFLAVNHANAMAKLPKHFARHVERQWLEIYRKNERLRDANLFLLDVQEKIGANKALIAANDAELCAFAKARAQECLRVDARARDDDFALLQLRETCERYGITPPNAKTIKKDGQRRRMMCEKWWRRQIRKNIARNVEAAAIKLEMVSRRAGIYASDETVARRAQQRRRNENILKTIIASNELGQEYTLQELADLGVSNKEIRRLELMTRIAGFDEYAIKNNHKADFFTVTAPSKYHAIMSKTGAKNPKYNDATPREAQAYLCEVWKRTRAQWLKHGIRVYGFRVVEPHHDGTPHWHMMLFYDDSVNQKLMREIFREQASREDAAELDNWKARKARFFVEPINRKKGSAVGYLAKYISKNINGAGMDNEDYEGAYLDESVARVDAWAACWGIRQFQQIGGAPVGVWRELRRLGGINPVTDTGILAELQAATDSGNWYNYTCLQGGAFVARDALRARCYRVWNAEKISLYDGNGVIESWGVKDEITGEIVKTKLHEWTLKRALAPSWSSVNNCNQKIEKVAKNGSVNDGTSESGAIIGSVETENKGSRRSIVTAKRKSGARGVSGGL
jgi:hypothetical protein